MVNSSFYSFSLIVGLLKKYIFLYTFYQFLLMQISRTNFGYQTGYIWKVSINKLFETIEKTSSVIGLLTVEHIELYKFHLPNCLWLPIEKKTFCFQNGYFWKVPIGQKSQNLWKSKSFCKPFSYSLTVEHIQLYKFNLWNRLWFPMHTG